MAGKRAGDGTAIEWTHLEGFKGVTWNPTVGCTRVSAGCDHCYAFALHDQRYAANLKHARQLGYATTQASRADPTSFPPAPAQYDRPFSEVQVLEDRIEQPLHWKAPRAVFVDSMADLFHEDVPDDVLDHIFAVMAQARQHVFMILTKRPERMRECIRAWVSRWSLPNVWLGVSVEDQAAAASRIPLLLATPAARRFLSCEPLLGPLNLRSVDAEKAGHADLGMYFVNVLTGRNDDMGRPCPEVEHVDWVIVGGESGRHHRGMDDEWARHIRNQCVEAGVPFFYKQRSDFRPGQPGPGDLNGWKQFPPVVDTR